jgi:biotin carboxyl carrier protein
VQPDERRLAILAGAGALPELQPPVSIGCDPWRKLGAWQHSVMPRDVAFADGNVCVERSYADGAWRVTRDREEALVRADDDGAFSLVTRGRAGGDRFTAWLDAANLWVALRGSAIPLMRPKPPADMADARQRHGGAALRGAIEAPMSGTVVKVNVTAGDTVKALAVLMVIEAMKMEHVIVAPYEASVSAVKVRAGQSVAAGDVLVELEES